MKRLLLAAVLIPGSLSVQLAMVVRAVEPAVVPSLLAYLVLLAGIGIGVSGLLSRRH